VPTDEFGSHNARGMGTIPASAFVDALRAIPLSPTDDEVRMLIDFYANSMEREVNHENYSHEINEFASSRMRQNPALAGKLLDEPSTVAPPRNRS